MLQQIASRYSELFLKVSLLFLARTSRSPADLTWSPTALGGEEGRHVDTTKLEIDTQDSLFWALLASITLGAL